jgi:hypothetical protein
MIKFAIVLFNPTTLCELGRPITPYLRHGWFIGRVPGNKLPGYLHSVPSGQMILALVHVFEATSILGDEDELSKPYRPAVPQCNDTAPQVSDPEGWNLRCLTASSAW